MIYFYFLRHYLYAPKEKLSLTFAKYASQSLSLDRSRSVIHTTIRGAEIKNIDNLYFAGEHCSANFQGFKNGAAETGRIAAKTIAQPVKAVNNILISYVFFIFMIKKNRCYEHNRLF